MMKSKQFLFGFFFFLGCEAYEYVLLLKTEEQCLTSYTFCSLQKFYNSIYLVAKFDN